ncbi:calpain family cysteine protease (macronuclear) [Tetrahymena thermophila SB210]|uniref:Calpain family cysteine protease n=1 Tax=Tetrahymena thermophila (strain SB210) TaxID=312017 RepID=W7XKR9_TETTS|nr:calpain family cysteine protease [Tetrahymena thermophila SB210]EWS75149.1 calpain family cysteine protease [Tetrahymena thermophila SB210]|eukprot:XP_012652305.1 calpain family cysteine protease [Tetrahymena thermophila SB210]
MLQIIQFFLTIISLCNSQNTQQIDAVYSPLMLNQLSSTDSLWNPLIVKVATDIDLVFVSLGFRGIAIINEKGDQIVHTQDLGNNYVSSFESTSDGQYLFIVASQNLLVYHLDFKTNNSSNLEMQNFDLLQNVTFQKNILVTNYNQQKELLIIAVKGGDIFIYDTSVKNMLSLISTFNTDSVMINNMFLSQDGQWLYVASDVKGLYMLNLQEQFAANQYGRKINIQMAALGTVGLSAYQGIATRDNIFIYAIDFWYGFFYSNSSYVVNSNSTQYPIQLSFTGFWPFQNMQTECQVMIMNRDETFIFLGIRSQGIAIFDIRQRNNIQVVELIKSDTLFISIQLSKTENYLYFSSSNSIFTYTQDEPNLNQDLPNLFNTHQIKYQDFLDMVYKWRCYIDPDDQYLIGGFDVRGIYVFTFNQDPYSLDVNNFKNYDIPVDAMYFEKSNKYLVVPRYFSEQGIGIFQYNPLSTNPDEQNISLQNMKLLKDYKIEDYQVSEMIVFSADTKFAVQTYMIGLIIYDSANIFNLTMISRWYNKDFMKGENQGACFTRDNNWIYSTIRLFGVYLLNVHDKANPILTDYIITHGGENVIMSQIFDSYLYLLDGSQGFGIIDSSYAPQLRIISRIQLPGYSIDALLINEEQYILITSMGKGFLTLIDIRNKNFPQIVNSISYENQYSYALCSPKLSQYLFITTSAGIIVLPTHSQIQIHTHVSLVQQNKITGQQILSKLQKQALSFDQDNISKNLEFVFTVGQQIQFNFAILYLIDQNIQINNINYYQQGQNLPIPSFFSFNKFLQSLQFFVDKSLVYDNINQPNLNIILLQTVIPLNTQSFIQFSNQTDVSVINITQSQMIYEYLQQYNIIDTNGIINNQFDFTQPFHLDLQFQNQLIDPSTIQEDNYTVVIEQITWIIKLTLMRSFYINPIKFYVQTSLSFDNQNINQFITSNTQNTISLTLSVNSTDGKLIFKTNPSVVFQLSDLQDQLIIQGSLENVNKVLYNQIIFANKTQITSKSSPKLTLTIQDDINYPLIKQFNIYKSQFIILKKQLQVNSENNLQIQINKNFPGGIIDIESDIAFSFSKDSFIVSDTQVLTYQYFYLQSPNNYNLMPPNFWLQESGNSDMSFKGSTTSKMFQKSYAFKIIASDGYTSAEDVFVLEVSGIPLIYLLNLLLKIIGPIIFLLSLIQQRSVFLNAIFRKRVTFSQEVAVKKKLEIDLKQLKPHDQPFLIEQKYMDSKGNIIMSHVIKDLLNYDIKIKQLDKHNFKNDIQNIDSKIYRALRAQISRYFLNLDYRSFIVYSYIKYFCSKEIQNCQNDWFKALIKIDYQQCDVLKLSQQCQKQQKVFPKLELKYDVLLQILQFLKLFPQQLNIVPNSFEQFIELCIEHQSNINLYLIREVIFADTYGFCGEKTSKLKVAFGQSLHIDSQNIKQIIACKKRKISKWFRPFYKLLNLEYTQYGISKNMRLPTWLYLDQKNGVIILHGIPVQDDIEEILIRVLDNTGYVIQQYILKIVKNVNINQQSNDIDQIYQVADEIEYQNDSNQSFKYNNQEIKILYTNDVNKTPSMFKRYSEVKPRQVKKQFSQSTQSPSLSPCKMSDYNFKIKKNSKNTDSQNIQLISLSEDHNTMNSFFNNNSNNKYELTLSQQILTPKCLQNTNDLEKVLTNFSVNKHSIDEINQNLDEIIE